MSERDPTVTLRRLIEDAVIKELRPVESLLGRSTATDIANDVAHEVLQRLAASGIGVINRLIDDR